ncbi:hypothetical protein [Deinococcus aerophilus]|uniref:Uncharacterized protein n=1 Tax=Deinococcus aerophilus TaxID=522488 RepID=A0ABQ2GV35_9DEIO|nr:hypothetical protein [Deinococcus aerophilus]GGM13282.1 hypothetical protein GCM10010841_22390 [Deinococcus aerophilus]
MLVHVLYAAHPPQCSFELTLEQLTRRDTRFGALPALQRRGVLEQVVQDSADLQQAHLRLKMGPQVWHGTPGALDEDGSGRVSAGHGWSEQELEFALGLNLVEAERHAVSVSELTGVLQAWPHGTVYVFGAGSGAGEDTLQRRFNLTSFTDRLELEFLAQSGFAELGVLRAHRIGGEGRPHILRAGNSAAHGGPV